MDLKKLGLNRDQRRAIESFRNGYGARLWKANLARWYGGERRAMDTLYVNDERLLMSTKEIVLPVLVKISLKYSGPDRD